MTRAIDAPAATVWALLTDADGYQAWNDAVISLRGPIDVDNTIELVSIADPKRTLKLKVVAMEAPERMVWTDGMPFGLFTGRRTYTLTPTDDNGCQFTMIEEFTGPLAALITKAIPDLTESFTTFADSLVAAAESARSG